MRRGRPIPSPPPSLFSLQVYPPIQTPRDGSHGNPRRPLAEWKFTVDLRNLLRFARPRAMERAKRKCTVHCALPKTTLFTRDDWRICECVNAESLTWTKHIFRRQFDENFFIYRREHRFNKNVSLPSAVRVEIAKFWLWLIPSELTAKSEAYGESANFTSVWTINSLI